MQVPFIQARGLWLGAVILVLALTALLQASISYTVIYGPLHDVVPGSFRSGSAFTALQFGLLVLMAGLWLSRRKRAVFRLIMLANGFLTFNLLAQTYALARILSGINDQHIDDLLADVVLLAVVNILVFSVWYWIIDPPGVDDQDHADQPWDFLFPQRGSPIPHYQAWVPHYTDYLFVAFTTSFAFSPTDVMPLTRRAKMLMMLQASISIITLTGLAGSAINILASSS